MVQQSRTIDLSLDTEVLEGVVNNTTFSLATYTESLSRLHNHICPRQILGLRMGLLGASVLHIDVPQHNKHLLAFVELNGCFADGISVATGCTLGHRTMYLMDCGKTAVTLVDTETYAAIRLLPHPNSRQRALEAYPKARSHWHSYLEGYQSLTDDDLLTVQEVRVTLDLKKLISRAGYRVTCEVCGEEIINEREVYIDNRVLCRTCAGETYYVVSSLPLLSRLHKKLEIL